MDKEDVSHLKDVAAERRVVITRNQAGRLDGIELVPLWRFMMDDGGKSFVRVTR